MTLVGKHSLSYTLRPHANEVTLGDVVRVGLRSSFSRGALVQPVLGIVRHLGGASVTDPSIKFIGLELMDPFGDSDGGFLDATTGRYFRYFKTAPNHAVYVDVKCGIEKVTAGNLLLQTKRSIMQLMADNSRLQESVEQLKHSGQRLLADVSMLETGLQKAEAKKAKTLMSLATYKARLSCERSLNNELRTHREELIALLKMEKSKRSKRKSSKSKSERVVAAHYYYSEDSGNESDSESDSSDLSSVMSSAVSLTTTSPPLSDACSTVDEMPIEGKREIAEKKKSRKKKKAMPLPKLKFDLSNSLKRVGFSMTPTADGKLLLDIAAGYSLSSASPSPGTAKPRLGTEPVIVLSSPTKLKPTLSVPRKLALNTTHSQYLTPAWLDEDASVVGSDMGAASVSAVLGRSTSLPMAGPTADDRLDDGSELMGPLVESGGTRPPTTSSTRSAMI